MITSLVIRNFRGLKDVSLNDLRRVNLLVGGNDTGKTSVLEALILLIGGGDLVAELPTTFRSSEVGGESGRSQDDTENFWPWLFYNRDVGNAIEIKAQTDGQQTLTLRTAAVPNGISLVRDVGPQGGGKIMGLSGRNVDLPGIAAAKEFNVS